MNAEQASKRVTWEPTRLSYGEGRRRLDENSGEESSGSHRGIGDGMHDKEIERNTGSPRGEGVTSTGTPRGEGRAVAGDG